MAATNNCDVTNIHDEDTLRRMWQETEDFGKKKEIRAHMYKIREARLRDFYSTGEVSKDIQRTNSSPGLREQRKGGETTHHADSLLDHSFLSLKSKEIRDSESPTRDLSYKISDTDKGWTIKESKERSQDGKTHTVSRTATTSGSQNIKDGVANYAAKQEQKSSVYKDGDEHNYTKAVGASNTSVIKQEAHGGDENSKFYSTSTSSKSSSKFVSESKSTSGDVNIQPGKEIITHTYTQNIPAELKKHPSYVEGKTKVYTETKTLPDGSTMTTTRYETTGGKTQTSSSYSSSTQKVSSSSEQKTSSSHEERSSSRMVKDSRGVDQVDKAKMITYSHPEVDIQCVRSDLRNEREQRKSTRDEVVDQNVSREQKFTSGHSEKHQTIRNEKVEGLVHTSTTDQKREQVIKGVDSRDNLQRTKEEIVIYKEPTEIVRHKTTATKTIVGADSKLVSDNFINVERQHVKDTSTQKIREISPVKEPNFQTPKTQESKPQKPAKYEQPARRELILPAKSEWETTSKPAAGQYDTTYGCDYTNKRISVDVSPTHDAFARSLRSVTPDRERSSKCSSPTRGSIRSFRTSTTSLRSSSSPDKNTYPERRGSSPRKPSRSPDKSTETIIKTFDRKSPQRQYSTDTITRRSKTDTYNTDTITKTSKTFDSSTLTKRPKKPKDRSRSSSPTDATSDFEFKSTRNTIVTDLDEDTTITKERPKHLELTSTITKRTKKITDRSPTSPFSEIRRQTPSPTKETPRRSSLKTPRGSVGSPTKQDFKPFTPKVDKILRRTDTYEERCRQILGIAERKKVERNITDIITSDRNRAQSPEKKTSKKPSLPDAARRTSKSPEKRIEETTVIKSSTKLQEYPAQKRNTPSPNKEFPSQIRRTPSAERKIVTDILSRSPNIKSSSTKRSSPEKVFLREGSSDTIIKSYSTESKQTIMKKQETVSERKTSRTDSKQNVVEVQTVLRSSPDMRRSPSPDKTQISEYPAQIRKSPEREEYPAPTRRSPGRDEFRRSPEHDETVSKPISEFPAQIRRSPEKEFVTSPINKPKSTSEAPTISEFPAQIRKSPERQATTHPSPKPKTVVVEGPTISEFPAQIRKTPEREFTVPPNSKPKSLPEAPTITEFPAQIRKTPEREVTSPPTSRPKPKQDAPTLSEFPAQTRKTPEREVATPPDSKPTPKQEAPIISEFPAQKRKSPEREEAVPPPAKSKPLFESPQVPEFPVQKKKTPAQPTPEDEVIEKTLKYLEGQIETIEEPMFVQKFIQKLGSDDEEEILTQETKSVDKKILKKVDSTKKIKVNETKSQKSKYFVDEKIDLEVKKSPEKLSPIRGIPDIPETTHKSVKKDLSRNIKKETVDFIKNEKKDTTTTTKSNQKVKQSVPEVETKTRKCHKVVDNIEVVSTKKVKETAAVTKTPQKNVKTVREIRLVNRPSQNKLENVTKIKEIKVNEEVKIPLKPSQPITRTIIKKPTLTEFPAQRKQTPTKPEGKVMNKTPSNKELTNYKTKVVHEVNKSEVKTSKKIAEPKRAVVSATINFSPKKPMASPKTIKKNVTVTTVKTTKIESPKRKPLKEKPLQNGHAHTDEEDEEEDLLMKNKSETKCVSTKSIIINNTVADQREIIVDLQRSKSSREDTPDNVWPITAEEDSGIPRYPDQIVEPEEPHRKFKRINDIPLTESEDVTEFSRISELVDTQITDVDRVQETDDCLLTVNEKVSKFLNTADQLTKKPKRAGPPPKVERPSFVIDDELEEDECLLSVSDKVNKFITTAEKLTVEIQERPKSPRCQNFKEIEETLTKVSDKVSKFKEQEKPKLKGVAPKQPRPDLADVDETIKTDECLLSVSDKVNKFISTAEKLTTSSITKKVEEPIPDCPTIATEEEMYKPRDKNSPLKEKSPPKSNEITPKTTKIIPSKEKFAEPQKKVVEVDATPKTSRRISQEDTTTTRRSSQEDKIILSSVGRLRSTESIKKARALFENLPKEEKPKQKDILSRPSVFEARKSTKTDVKLTDIGIEKKNLENVRKRLDYEVTDSATSRISPPKIVPEIIHASGDSDVPGYMRQLDRSLRPKSPHKESVFELEQIAKGQIPSMGDAENVKPNKFGVVLKKTDAERRRSSEKTSIIVKDEMNIEEIFDLKLLLLMMDKATGYDLRRRLRAQIRLVNKLNFEKKVEISRSSVSPTRSTTSRGNSPEKKITESKSISSIKSEKKLETTSSEQESHSYTRRTSETKTSSSRKSSLRESPMRLTAEFKVHKSPEREVPAEIKFKPFRKSPERRTKPETKVFTPELKRTNHLPKQLIEDKPEWITQRNLRKVSERTPVTKKTSSSTVVTSSSTTKKESKRTSPSKEIKSTDVITSSYGVGPTDENGSPLFGLRALRAQNKNEKTKVQGTVMHSTFYSENGKEPIGEISVTEYSTDPKDLGPNDNLVHKDGLLSKTTTQKFGYKNTPSLKTLTDKKRLTDKNDELRTSTTTRVTRRGSVKEMSQKFLENAVETLKSERQSSYPKAGLILRSSSFKGSSGSSREGSPPVGSEEIRTNVTVEESSKASSSSTFLTNTSKVTGLQDVITRMKNEDIREGENSEDVEARTLLNRFLGSQVILSGMQEHNTRTGGQTASSSTSSTTKRTTKVTSTVTENGIPKTITQIFTHPITPDVLEEIWDEQTLRLLLEQSTEYEERRVIRARLKQVMAEREICSQFVEKTLEETQAGNVQGESLLLPLLQGVLDAPEIEQTPDSGTESGEDLRSGLIAEVQNALNKLSACLCSDTSDITSERRDSLLQLVGKLQTTLTTSQNPQDNNPERRLSGSGRFGKRRQRQNRHTVGVTSEELEDARRLMEEFALHESQLSEFTNPLQKQNSESSVQSKPAIFRPVKFQPHQPIKNSMPKPFTGSTNTSQSQSGTSSTVETPTTDSLDLLYTEKPEDVAYFENPTITKFPFTQEEPPPPKLMQSISLDSNKDVELRLMQEAVQQAARNKIEIIESETDEDTMKVEVPNQLKEGETVVLYDQSIYPNANSVVEEKKFEPQPDVVLKNNPIYSNPVQKLPFQIESDEKANKFNTKKLKMKRANTIDIPKPLNYYQIDDDESEGDLTDDNTHRNQYLALRGPIRVGKINSSNVVPAFEPKTESDKKFLAFINKQNENNKSGVANKISLWDKTVASQNIDHGTNWTRKFGNIKTNFENGITNEPKKVNSARNFWKSADDAVAAGTISYNGPKISKQNARNLQQMFEQKQKQNQSKLPWSEEKNVVTGSLKVDTKNLEPHKNYKFVPQPLLVNKFSHNPQSAFKPIQKVQNKPEKLNLQKNSVKTNSNSDTSTPGTPLYLYSPKSFDFNGPVHHTPWSAPAKTSERRVLSLAAAKFENPPPEEPKIKPRKVSKEKVIIPSTLEKVETKDKVVGYTAPVTKSGGTVRKLSGQYDSKDSKIEFVPQTKKPLHQSAFASVPQKGISEISKYNQKHAKSNESPKNQYNEFNRTPKTENYYSAQTKPQDYYPTQSKTVEHYSAQPQYVKSNSNYYDGRNEAVSKTHYDYPEKKSYVAQNYQEYPNYASETKFQDYETPYQSSDDFHTASPQNYHSSSNTPDFDAVLQPQNYLSPDAQNFYSTSPAHLESNYKSVNELPPSFHTTSPQVQQLQKMYHIDQIGNFQTPEEINYQTNVLANFSNSYENKIAEPTRAVSPIHHQSLPELISNQALSPPQQYIHPEPHVYYNNVHGYDHHHHKVNIPDSEKYESYNQTCPKYEPYDQTGAKHETHNQSSSKYQSQVQAFPKYEAYEEIRPKHESHNQTRPKYESQTSQESVHEYTAISSKVMSGPISQQAVTVQQNQPKNRNDHDMDLALKNSLMKKTDIQRARSPKKPDLKPKSPSFSSIKPKTPNFSINDKPLNLESLEINEKGESIVTSKFQIPMKGVPYDKKQTQMNVLSKCDSWHQICQDVSKKPSPRASPNARSVMKSKSTHTLALPKQFEAGLSRDEIVSKKKTVEAYFTGNKSPNTVETYHKEKSSSKRTINRLKTSEKMSISRQSTEKIETTKKSFSEGPLSRTQMTTTTRVTSQQVTKKPLSPFAKFHQLDKQNSLNTPPSTPKTPTSGGPLFKFTDPNLCRSASTIKERLLQWCQMKTKEYENIKLDNFSTSWADGLAFCALIHHFLPDAFDYHQLTPHNRRHNFTLAFQIADEKADIFPLLDVDDMVATRKPDWKCVFTYVQSIYRRFKDED